MHLVSLSLYRWVIYSQESKQKKKVTNQVFSHVVSSVSLEMSHDLQQSIDGFRSWSEKDFSRQAADPELEAGNVWLLLLLIQLIEVDELMSCGWLKHASGWGGHMTCFIAEPQLSAFSLTSSLSFLNLVCQALRDQPPVSDGYKCFCQTSCQRGVSPTQRNSLATDHWPRIMRYFSSD